MRTIPDQVEDKLFVRCALRSRAVERKAMIDRSHDVPLTRQAKLLKLCPGSLYYAPCPAPAAELALMRRIDELHLEFPFAGARMLRNILRADGFVVGREMVAGLMRRMGIEALYRRRNTSKSAPSH